MVGIQIRVCPKFCVNSKSQCKIEQKLLFWGVSPLALLAAVVSIISVATALRDEANIQMAFTKDELRNGSPILINKKRIKGTDVIQREFYSNIPLRIWKKRTEDLSDSLNVHFVEEIRYGGKSNGKRIVICTAPSRDLPNRTILYDDEF